MSARGHDWAAQEAETRAVFAELAEGDIPYVADVTYSFVPGPKADWDGFEAALTEAGFEVSRCDDGDEEDEDDEEAAEPCLIAALADQPITALAIWTGERQATELALAHGFEPDGWGFWA